jgi:hypothetical protein
MTGISEAKKKRNTHCATVSDRIRRWETGHRMKSLQMARCQREDRGKIWWHAETEQRCSAPSEFSSSLNFGKHGLDG